MNARSTNNVVNLKQKLSLFSEHWEPKVIADMNDYQFKLAKVEGEFVWHDHPDTDEVFLVIDGSLVIELEEETVTLNAGEMFVVPKGVRHKPVAATECHIMLIEPRGTVNTGDESSSLTAPQDVYI